jgi:hypothetical protein
MIEGRDPRGNRRGEPFLVARRERHLPLIDIVFASSHWPARPVPSAVFGVFML